MISVTFIYPVHTVGSSVIGSNSQLNNDILVVLGYMVHSILSQIAISGRIILKSKCSV